MKQSAAGALPSLRQLAIVYRPTSSLKPDPRNARTHPKRQIEQIVKSIQEFGFTNPVLIDEADVLIAGHGRLRAAKELSLDEVPTITLTGLSAVQKKALRLADNKIALNAGWDVEILRLELSEIGTLDVDFDLSLTGFASAEIDVMLKPRMIRTTRSFPLSRWSRGRGRATFGSSESTVSAAVTAAIWNF